MTYRTFGSLPHKTFTPGAKEDNNASWMDDEAQRLSPDVIAETYLFLHQQDRSSWTLELDLRPAKVGFLPSPFLGSARVDTDASLQEHF